MLAYLIPIGSAPGDYFILGHRCDHCHKSTLYLRIDADGNRSLICYRCD